MADEESIADEITGWVRTNYPTIADILDRGAGYLDALFVLGRPTTKRTTSALKQPDDPYFIPSDEILTFKTSGKLVRLDVAVMAIHFFIARVYFRSITHLTTQKLSLFSRKLVEFATSMIANKAGGKEVASKAMSILSSLLKVFEVLDNQRTIEASIRLASLKTQRELNVRCLGGKRPPRNRKRKYVWSRHPKKNGNH